MFNKNEYPKVLVVDPTPFNRNRNNGIVKSNLFQGWPKERLAQIDYSNIQPGFDVCEHYWVLRKLDIIKGFIGFPPVAKLLIPQKLSTNIYNPENTETYDNRPIIERGLSIIVPDQLRMIIAEIILRLPSLLSKPLLYWIDNFKPDIIFSVLSYAPIVRMVVKVSQHYDIPILPLYTDDWVSTLYKNNVLSTMLRSSLLNYHSKCLERSPISLTANNVMKSEYIKRYGGRFETMLFPEEFRSADKKHSCNNNDMPVRLVYIGSLTPNRWQSLRRIGEALHALRLEGINGELNIYTFPSDIEKYKKILTLDPVMRVIGTARPEAVKQLQNEAEVLVHVESFHPEIQKMTAFSLSTKISQYLMAGACIFGYGPEDVASMKYLSDSGVAVIVGKDDATLLYSTLKKLINDACFRQLLGKKAHIFAVHQHEASKQRELFRSYVVEACNMWQKNRSHSEGRNL